MVHSINIDLIIVFSLLAAPLSLVAGEKKDNVLELEASKQVNESPTELATR